MPYALMQTNSAVDNWIPGLGNFFFCHEDDRADMVPIEKATTFPSIESAVIHARKILQWYDDAMESGDTAELFDATPLTRPNIMIVSVQLEKRSIPGFSMYMQESYWDDMLKELSI